MRNHLKLALLLAAGCQPVSPTSNPLSLANDYLVSSRPYGERNLGLTNGDGPNNSHLIFLNFAGASIVAAPDGFTDNSANNQSWLAKGTRTLPAFDASPYAGQYTQATAIAAITNQYKAYYAPYNVTISTTRPASGRYLMVMIGGSPADLQGGSNNTSEAGVSPLDCGNMEESNIAFNFAATLAPNKTGFGIPDAIMQIAADAAHESGHSFGLEHVNDETDVMNPVLEPTITGFHGVNTLSDGSSSCGSGNTQNTAALLLSNLGAASANTQPVNTPPTVSFSSPADGADVGLTFQVKIAAPAETGATITKVDLSQGGTIVATLTAAPFQHSFTVTAGAYDFTATATDSNGLTATAMLSVTAADMTTMPTPTPSSEPSPTPSMPPPSSLSGKPVGASCTTAGECANALCASGVCTVHCDPSQVQACGAGYTCEAQSTGGDVCLPIGGTSGGKSGGCSVGGAQSANGGATLFMLMLLAVAGFRRRFAVNR